MAGTQLDVSVGPASILVMRTCTLHVYKGRRNCCASFSEYNGAVIVYLLCWGHHSDAVVWREAVLPIPRPLSDCAGWLWQGCCLGTPETWRMKMGLPRSSSARLCRGLGDGQRFEARAGDHLDVVWKKVREWCGSTARATECPEVGSSSFLC